MRCVVLDDYQRVALRYADWESLQGVDVRVIAERLTDEALLRALAPAEVIVAMGERTMLPRALLQQLPRLRLIARQACAPPPSISKRRVSKG